jgi:chromatin segregation and condensation protein Rec8/ScpA/Scc1 (kleisin family)
MPSIPQLCAILGNDVLLDWLRVNTNELRVGRHELVPRLSELELLRLLSEIGKEMGDVNNAVNKALANDGLIDKQESKKIIRESYDVLSRYREIIVAMRAIQEGT